MKKYIALSVGFLALSSCFKEDDRIAAQEVFEEIGRVDMVSENGVDYPKQVYFDLSTNQARAFNQRDKWDLALGCEVGKPNLFTNASLNMRVAQTGSFQWGQSFNTADFEFQYERVDRFFSRGLIASDFSGTNPSGEVFIIDLGKDLQNKARGYRLLQLIGYDDQSYTLRIANLDYSFDETVKLQLNPACNFVYIALDEPKIIMELEPPKGEWDLWFTKYMERLYDGTDTLDYSVTGCLINPYLSSAALYPDSLDFDELSLQNTDLSILSTRTSSIGHNWKYFDLDKGLFSVHEDKIYLIQDSDGSTYKMAFTGFYDDASRKGAVSFKFITL